MSIKELKDKDLPNLIWTLEPEKFYVDMRPYKEHEERKKRREEEAKVRMQGEEQENIMIERKKWIVLKLMRHRIEKYHKNTSRQ